jgi:cell division protein FtsA
MGGAILGRNHIVASLDLGTSKTCCLIGEITRSGDVDVIGYGISPASGIKKGIITNIDTVVQSIAKAVEQAEQMANTKISHVVIGLSGGSIALLNNRGVVAIPRSEKEITPQDVERVLQAAKIMAIPYDREIIDVIPREFIVDGCDGIKDPVGMVGTRLEVSACIITGLLTAIQNTIRCVQKAGLLIEGMVLKPLAAAEMLLTADEMDMGVILVDVGAGTTEIAAFQEGCIIAYSLIPIGGDYITNDIAIGLRLPFSQAEEIKRRYACARVSLASDKPEIEIKSIGDTSGRKISQKELTFIVEPRIQEILSFVMGEIKNFNLKSPMPAGVVLTGGGLIHIKGSLEMAQQFFGLPVRLGVTDAYDKEQIFTVALGLLYYRLKHKTFENKSLARESPAFGFLEKARRLLKEYF